MCGAGRSQGYGPRGRDVRGQPVETGHRRRGVSVGDVLDAAAVRRWSRLAADALGRTRGDIDSLNVFPVPDGDTGTNLHLTVLAAAEAADAGGTDGAPDGAEGWRARGPRAPPRPRGDPP